MLESLQRTLADPHALHAAAVHAPVVLPHAALLILVAWACTRFRFRALAVVAAGLLVMASVSAGVAAGSGEEALERIEASASPLLTDEERAALDRHAGFGEGGWMWPCGAAALIAGALLAPKKHTRTRLGLAIACVGAAGGVAVWATLAGHSGGEIVYVHGLGVPGRGVTPPP